MTLCRRSFAGGSSYTMDVYEARRTVDDAVATRQVS
jgi:hypothetical protein